MTNRTVGPNDHHRAFYEELVELLKKHGGELKAEEMLAIASQVVGKIIAYQDRNTMTLERATQIVQLNIEAGNQQVLNEEIAKRGGQA